jgi:demethylmenaquinone methyltransferase/2-methoxy-6-polyprenyl-1,4-benzoquinol methylase
MSPSLRTALASPDGKRRYVRTLFSTIADRYDLITRLLSYGQDRQWKQRVVALACSGRAGDSRRAKGLDLASGTGDIAFALASRGVDVVGLDITHRMLVLAAAKRRDVAFITADMTALPFPARTFDIVTTGYGLRNVPDIETALAEIARVLRPGGVFVSLDFNRPSNAVVRGVYLTYLTVIGSTLGFLLHRDPDTYRYIPESIRRYPGARAVNEMVRAAGFPSSEYIPVLGGLMAIHRATRANEQ